MPNDPSAAARIGRSATRFFGGALLMLAIGLALYTWFTLWYTYSSGERAGLLQKFSNKGWVCKTYEGELALYVVAGVAPEVWHFSVRDEAVAAQMAKAVGQRVQLHYTEHPGIPTSCFGETRYFVDRINSISELTPATGMTPSLGVAPVQQVPLAVPATPAPAAVPASAPETRPAG